MSALYHEVIQRSGDAITYVLHIHSLGGNTIVLLLQYATSCSWICSTPWVKKHRTHNSIQNVAKCWLNFRNFHPQTLQ